MLNYLIFGIALIIFLTVIVVAGKAISRGIEAKQIQMKKKVTIPNFYQVQI